MFECTQFVAFNCSKPLNHKNQSKNPDNPPYSSMLVVLSNVPPTVFVMHLIDQHETILLCPVTLSLSSRLPLFIIRKYLSDKTGQK